MKIRCFMSLLHYPGEDLKLGRKKLEKKEGRKGKVILPDPASMVPIMGCMWGEIW